MFHGEHCVAITTAFEEISKLSRRCLHGWTVSTHVKFEHFLNIFIGVIHYIGRLHYSLSSLDRPLSSLDHPLSLLLKLWSAKVLAEIIIILENAFPAENACECCKL